MKSIFSIGFVLWAYCLAAQNDFPENVYNELCGTTPHMEALKKAGLHDDQKFEQWLSEKISERRRFPRRDNKEYKIPIIFHIVHNGEPIGTETNLSAAQVKSQVEALNAAIQRKNFNASQTRNTTEANFASIAGSINLTFELATLGPEGLPLDEPEIRRINGAATFGKNLWTPNDCNFILKPTTIWNPQEYFNVWVVQLPGTLSGFAQFPSISSTLLPGITSTPGYATDGVVMHHRALGSNVNSLTGVPNNLTFNLFPFAQQGNILVHEVGHWLGLRHIWGDVNSCINGNDFADDTPPVSGPNSTSRTCEASKALNTCGAGTAGDQFDMIENYMDYTNDQCMNLFTQKQVDRMITVLENSPRQLALLSSTKAQSLEGKQVFAAFTNNFTEKILNTTSIACIGSRVSFKDISKVTGNAPNINNWEWEFDVTGVGGASINTFSGQNPPLISFNTPGEYQVRLKVSNGSSNSSFSKTILVLEPNSSNFPVYQDFQTGPKGWSFEYLILQEGWYFQPVGNNSTVFVPHFFLDFQGRSVEFYSPPLDLRNFQNASISFDVAYAFRTNGRYDDLEIGILSNCRKNYIPIWKKDGISLATRAGGSNGSFSPTSPSDWRRETIELGNIGALAEENIAIVFKSIGRGGNNMYIDNIEINGIGTSPFRPANNLVASFNLEKLGVDLQWSDNSDNESKFEIERSFQANSNFNKIGEVSSNVSSYEDKSAGENETYYYRIKTLDDNNNSAYSLPTSQVVPIFAPTNLKAENIRTANKVDVKLSWNDNSLIENAYTVERSENKDQGCLALISLPRNSNSFEDKGLSENKVYYYRVRANALGGISSEYTNIIDTIPIFAPTDFQALATELGSVILTWKDESEVETSYEIQRADKATGQFAAIGSTAANATTFEDKNVEIGEEYTYRIRAKVNEQQASIFTEKQVGRITSLANNAIIEQIKLYPNPASKEINFNLGAITRADIVLKNSVGHVVLSQKRLENNSQLSIASLAQGFYLVEVHTSTGTEVIKLIIE